MTLFEILDEISIGYHQNDAQSKKLQNYVKKVIEVLSAENAIYEGRKITFYELKENVNNNLEGNTFLQGSYGTNTAIKHSSYEVDADIAFIIDNDNIDLNIRNLIYNKLNNIFGNKYIIEKKKPCITIDFKDKYKIDIAIYTRVAEKIYFHNSIDEIEKVNEAKPKDLINYFNSCYKLNDTRRKVIRLIKHFIKTSNILLEIEDCNRIPSISLNILLCKKNMHLNANEDELYNDILSGMNYIKSFVEINGKNGPKLEKLCIGDTFYKIRDINEVKKVIDKVIITLEHKQYDQIIERNVFNKINERKQKKVDSSFLGTMG